MGAQQPQSHTEHLDMPDFQPAFILDINPCLACSGNARATGLGEPFVGMTKSCTAKPVNSGVTRGFGAARKTLHDSLGLPDMPLKTLGFST
eukprot:1150199-Pelagomonas_calceolata.AAC.5